MCNTPQYKYITIHLYMFLLGIELRILPVMDSADINNWFVSFHECTYSVVSCVLGQTCVHKGYAYNSCNERFTYDQASQKQQDCFPKWVRENSSSSVSLPTLGMLRILYLPFFRGCRRSSLLTRISNDQGCWALL